MTKKLARLLRADIQETSDLKSIAAMLAGKGRGGDTLLAHITPREVGLLKEAGGAGTVNPDTGLLEFYDWSGGYGTTDPTSSYQSAPSSTPVFGDYSVPTRQDTSSFVPTFGDYSGPSQPVSAPAAAPVDISAGGFPGLGAPIPATFGQAEQLPPATPPSLSDRAGDILKSIKEGGRDVNKFIKENPELAKIGVSGVGALLNALQARRASKQVKESTAEQKALAAPYQKQGAEAQRAALAGELSPQEAQALQSTRAQLMQNVEARGGVGVAQAQAQLENTRQALLQQKLDYGIKLSSIGDNIALGAIRTGLQADQAVNQLTNSMYTNMLAIASGLTPQPARTATTQGAIT
jgi:hypothetical protein